MKAEQLIEALKDMPQDAEVWHLWDGEARTMIEHVWLSKDGKVITADSGEVCYSTDARPIDAPTALQSPYWKTQDEEE